MYSFRILSDVFGLMCVPNKHGESQCLFYLFSGSQIFTPCPDLSFPTAASSSTASPSSPSGPGLENLQDFVPSTPTLEIKTLMISA